LGKNSQTASDDGIYLSAMSNLSPEKKQVALITGANKGIGYEIARQLGQDHSMTVLIGARDLTRGRDAAAKLQSLGIDARAVELDVTDPASVEVVASQIDSDFGGRLDVLINNAGVSLETVAPSQTGLENYQKTHLTNAFGPLVVTKAMLPLLKGSAAGRIVNMSSGLGSLTQNSDPSWEYAAVKVVAYNSSKAALNMQTVLFAAELAAEGSPIKINSACPGYVDTDLTNHQGHRTVEEGAREAVRLATLPADGPSGKFFNEDGPLPW
jgi:NAD(P)-dependent dehydrogenase (short-subunit alcohol dehydrogenase family)